MNRFRIAALLTALVMLLSAAAYAEPQTDLDAANARIAELEAELAARDARIAELEALLYAVSGYSDGDAAAEFDGGIVTIGEARAEYEYRSYYYSSFGADAEDYSETLKQEVLESLVEDAVLRAKAEEYGLYELSEDDRAAIEQQAQQTFDETVNYYMVYRVQEGKTDEEIRQETIDYLASEDYTLESVVSTLTNQTWRDRLYAYVTRDLTLTEEALRQFYESELTSAELTYTADPLEYEYARLDGAAVLWNPEGYRRVKALLIGFAPEDQERLTDLLIDLENAADDAERSRLLEEIDALYAGLEPRLAEVQDRIQAGDDFMLLIDEYSDDEASTREPTRSTGYYVSAQSQIYLEEFRDAAMALVDPGDISGPVRSDLGIYLLQYVGEVTPGPVPFEEVRDSLTESALEGQRDQLYNDTVSQWLEDAHIVYYPERF